MVLANVQVFEVWEDGKKVDDGPAMVVITGGTPRTLTLKAHGFKDKTLTLDGSKTKVIAKMERVPGLALHPGSGSGSAGSGSAGSAVKPPNLQSKPGHPDCTQRVVDPHDHHCQQQYCLTHQDNPACLAED
jgi:hypothetical protein